MASVVGLTLNAALLLIVIAQAMQLHIDRNFPRRYCGRNLTRVMAESCLKYYSPYPENRVKRDITEECCHNKCSLDYLLRTYCASEDIESLNSIQSTVTQQTQRSSDPPQVRRLRKDTKGIKKARNKRNCLCKKNKLRKKHKKKRGMVNQQPRLGRVDEGGLAFYVK